MEYNHSRPHNAKNYRLPAPEIMQHPKFLGMVETTPEFQIYPIFDGVKNKYETN